MAVYAPDQMRLSITPSADGSVDFVRIQGDVDLSDSEELGVASQQLVESTATTVYVDLGGTTFMGSTLVAFLVKVANSGPTGRSLVLCRPTATARRVIQMTGLDAVAQQRVDLPEAWPDDADEPDHATGEQHATEHNEGPEPS